KSPLSSSTPKSGLSFFTTPAFSRRRGLCMASSKAGQTTTRFTMNRVQKCKSRKREHLKKPPSLTQLKK
ncbi:MAG: hypothetical protein WCL34_15045, partial [Methylococcaceae bacterium]